jgi:hypothetical protein
MSRTSFLSYKERRILEMDFTELKNAQDILDHIAEAKGFVATQPKNSLLVLLKVTNSTFNTAVVSALKDLADHDKPYVIASAIVGVEGLMSLILKTIAKATGRSFKLFNDDQSAMNWLIEKV